MVTEEQKVELLTAACAVRANSYAPYSNYHVGAAILLPDGRIMTGVNVENASYGLSNCAERTAIFKAVTEGYREILAIAICTENGGSPCGACRQVMVEFAGDIPVLLSDAAGDVLETTLYSLLPAHFGPEHLAE
ncbi:MAG: cytidine deaminase [Candidatus Promineifilaceae bacterium]|jgi:cytidine deaminase